MGRYEKGPFEYLDEPHHRHGMPREETEALECRRPLWCSHERHCLRKGELQPCPTSNLNEMKSRTA